MLSSFSSQSSGILMKKLTLGPTLQSFAANTNGLNTFGTANMVPNLCISDDGQNLFIMSSSATTQAAPRYSLNGGSTFLASTFTPAISSGANCWGCCSSSTNQYIIVITDMNPAYPYKSTDYGQTFTQWTSSNFGGLLPNNSNWMGGVSDDGVVWCFGCTKASHNGLYLCVNGSSTQSNDVFTRKLTGDCVGASCSISGNNIIGAMNNVGTFRHAYSIDRGVNFLYGTATIAGTTLQCQPLISNNGKRMWSITYNGSTQRSNYVDLDISTTFDLDFGVSQWLGAWAYGLPNLSDSDTSSSMKLMVVTMTAGTSAVVNSNNVFCTTDNGVTWNRLGTLISTLSTIKLKTVCCSKNGKYLLLGGSNNILYKVTFPTENV